MDLRAVQQKFKALTFGQAFDDVFFWIYRINSVALLLKSTDGFIAEFALIGRGAQNGHGFHG